MNGDLLGFMVGQSQVLGKVEKIKNKFTLPWLCAGDFNEILKVDEKLGGRFRPIRHMEAFREVLDECEFKDLG